MNSRVVTAYFSGTAFGIENERYLAAFLHKHTVDTASVSEKQTETNNFGFPGCAVVNPIQGTLFGTGLDEQCQTVVIRIRELIAQDPTKKVVLNVYGHSRGGIAGLLLAQMLKNISPEQLEINLVLMDPVPGNTIATAVLDNLFFGVSLASQALDLSDCKNLRRVLALYPYKPIDGFWGLFHTPIIPIYPKHCEVRQEVIGGCHAGAEHLYLAHNDEPQFRAPTFINFILARQFLQECGTQFSIQEMLPFRSQEADSLQQVARDDIDETLKLAYAECMRLINYNSNLLQRKFISELGVNFVVNRQCKYFNQHHKSLCEPNNAADPSDVIFRIEPATGFIPTIKAASRNHPYVWGAIKWLAVGIAAACALFFTGGWAALPFVGVWMAPHVLASGAFVLAVMAPVLATIAATLWYGLVKPIARLFSETFCLAKQNDDFANPIIQAKYPDPHISIFGRIKNTIANHPVIFGALGWLTLGVAAATALFFTGGLAAIPIAATLGPVVIAVAAPIISVALATVWHGFFKQIAAMFTSTCSKEEPHPFALSTKLILSTTGVTPTSTATVELAADRDESSDEEIKTVPLTSGPSNDSELPLLDDENSKLPYASAKKRN